MLSPKAPLLRDVLEEHLEELAFLWALRREGLSSPELTRQDLARFDARIEAHADGLALARGDLFGLVAPGLASDDASAAFAAAFPLLGSGRDGARAVLDAFVASGGEGRAGLAEALGHGPSRETREELGTLAASADAGLALAAATALALQRAPGAPARLEERLAGDADPAVRAAAWRLAPLLGEAPRPELVARGLADPDPAVALEAVVAAAWFSLPAALEVCRARARSEGEANAQWLRLLAILGDAPDLSFLLSAAADRGPSNRGATGPRMLGVLGHPRGVDSLLGMMGDDPARAAAAGAAFLKVTGFDAAGPQRTAVRDAEGDAAELEEELLDEVTLPDTDAARAFWSSARGAFAGGTRWCHGRDVSDGCPGELPPELDMESRWEVRLRGRFTGSWKGDAAGLWRMAPVQD